MAAGKEENGRYLAKFDAKGISPMDILSWNMEGTSKELLNDMIFFLSVMLFLYGVKNCIPIVYIYWSSRHFAEISYV